MSADPAPQDRQDAAAQRAPWRPGASKHSVAGALSWLTDADFGTLRGAVRLLLGEAEFIAGRLTSFLHPDFAATRRLVFVCLGNINRSAFAQAVAAPLGLRTVSIGLSTTTGAPAFPMAAQVAARYGLDLATHRATDYTDYTPAEGDLLLAMEVRHARALVQRGVPPSSIALLGHWARPHRIHVHDPHTLSETYFRTCFAILHSAVVNLADELRRHGSPCVLR